ncbi:TonB-dependent receptor [Sphingosinithalassobacter portus]|uniref:TonB-dependent receptor n=1 Tax=Stakelama portus TaxID=2676234 RepID=UPI0018752FEA|nr:TonB-dependent receptor [Sphingosinithalassobacter portus]
MRYRLLSACAVPALIISLAAPAQAQEATASQDAAAQSQDVSQSEIVVTAQGRAQVLADVPVAISAVSSEQLAESGTNDIRELNQLAPSLLVSSTGNEANGSARIRGIGTVGDNPGLESSVAVFIDGVYRSRSGNALGELGPIERIEVLRGPQGTLGGRNSSAGLLSIFTAPPEFEFSGYGAFTYGNYDAFRVEAGINAPIGETVAARVDGVYFKRDGFYHDVVNDTDINNRDRYLVRGQLLFEPSADLSVRIIGDYSEKSEDCCAATFVQTDSAPLARISPGLDPYNRPLPGSPALTSTSNPIIPILLALGQNPDGLNGSTYDRDIYNTAGRSFAGKTKDYGISGQIDYSFGSVNFTSITAYREYSNYQGSDTDYTQVDILYRAPNEDGASRAFKTFSQELRLQGSAFDDKVDWLIGGYYANEKLETRDNLRFGTQYGAFAPCRVTIGLAGAGFGPGAINPANSGCLGNVTRAQLNSGLTPLGAAGGLLVAGLDQLSTLNDMGSTRDVYNQESNNFALFTHNIIHLTDRFDVTLGLRYTSEKKDFAATFGNDNTVCPANRALLSGLLGINPTLDSLAGGIIALSCQGNSTSELNGVSMSDSRSEDEFTGTAILSYRPTDDLMIYGSYSRGYKAGGFNLDRSALQASPVLGNPATTGSTANLQFDAETVNAFEIGAKYATRDFMVTIAGFRQEFSNFQLNTFNGSVFLVQNINGCSQDLGTADQDASAATGSCAAGDVTAGVIAQGVELEGTLRPTRDLTFTMGITYADTHYKDDLVGTDNGAPLDPALRLLPGDNLSNAPEIVATASMSWTPEIGSTGLSGLFYLNARAVDDYNTGSDLLYGKEQDSYVIVNGRIGIRGPDNRWGIEFWGQNLFNVDYTQVAFNTPFVAPQQTYSAYLAEPRTYGITLRAGF